MRLPFLETQWQERLVGAAFLFAPFLYCFLSLIRLSWQVTGLLWIMVATMLMAWPGPSLIGGSFLRMLGLGGGLPVHILVKTMDGKDVKATEQCGCLVLAIGSDVFIRLDLPPAKCTLQQTIQSVGAPAYSNLVRFARADILTISGEKKENK